ncbi:MAG: DUF6580 family putative transport protein [Flavobacteriaceae bacterium]
MERYNRLTMMGVMGIIVLAVVTRLIPHPPNFAPITGIALFSGTYFANKRWALLLPLLCLFITYVFLGFHSLMLVVYASFLLISAAAQWMQKVRFISVLGASVFFFLTSNFGVWYLYYPHTWEGFMQCYTLAIPFFGNTLAGDLFYTAALFYSAEKLVGISYLSSKEFV